MPPANAIVNLGPARAHRASVMANGGRPRFTGSPCFRGALVLAGVWMLLALIGATLLPWWPLRAAFGLALVAACGTTLRAQRRRWAELRAEFLAHADVPRCTAADKHRDAPRARNATRGN